MWSPDIVLLLLLWATSLAPGVLAQEQQSSPAFDAELERLEAIATTGAPREQLNSLIAAARETLTKLTALQQRRDNFVATVKNRDIILQDIESRSRALATQYLLPKDSDDTATLKLRLQEYENSRESARAQLAELNEQLAEMEQRRQQISNDLVAAGNAVQISQANISVENARDDVLADAQALLQSIQLQRNKLRVDSLQKELDTLPVRQSLLEAQVDLVSKQVKFIDPIIKQIRAALLQSDLRDARQTAANIQLQIAQASDQESRTALLGNLTYAEQLTTLTRAYYEEQSAALDTVSQLADLERAGQLLQRIAAMGRADGNLGEILHRIRHELPHVRALANEIERVSAAQIDLHFNSVVWQDKLDSSESKTEHRPQFDSSENVIAQRQNILRKLLAVSGRYDASLANHGVRLTTLQSEARELRRALDGRLLWLPTNKALSASPIAQMGQSIAAFLNFSSWKSAIADFVAELRSRPFLSTILYSIGLMMLWGCGRLAKSLSRWGARAGKVNKDTLLVTPIAVMISFVLAAAGPFLLGVTGKVLAGSVVVFSASLGVAMVAAAKVWLALNIFSALALPDGVFASHFNWGENARVTLASTLRWLKLALLPTTFVFTYAMTIGDADTHYGLGRPVFILISLAMAVAGYWVFRPGAHVVEHMFGNFRHVFAERAAYVSFAIVPLALAVLALIGYFDTAVILQSKLFESVLLILGAALLYGFLHRTYMVSARRSARKRAIARQQARRAKLVEDAKNDHAGDALPVYAEYEEDFGGQAVAIGKETHAIILGSCFVAIVIGLYLVWRPILPALDIADTIVLWQGVGVVDGISINTPVTLGDGIVALLFILGGVFLARNMDGILALGIAQKVDLRPGTRYAVTTILGYLFVGGGLILGLSKLGVDWSKLQWIIAALGVGLGFGLQEIVANFVSGLIILFERPIRVGDIVTVGSLDGTVSKISIRATTITDFEHRDVLIPNKSIITENVKNWTLGNTVTRLLIKIGIGYNDDISKARDLMLDIVSSHPNVLEDPGPSVYFVAHSESTLDFQIRAYVAATSHRLSTQHDLNEKIHNTLKAEGFDLPYPQRSIHVISDEISRYSEPHPGTAG